MILVCLVKKKKNEDFKSLKTILALKLYVFLIATPEITLTQ